MAFNQQNLSPGTAFFRFMLGSVMTTYGTVRLLHEPKSRSGKMLVLCGSMKAAEGATKFCPTKAIGTVMDNLANENAKSNIVKEKKFKLVPMTLMEAEEEMELLGHSFYVFLEAKTNTVQVLYKRNDGDLGLIEPEV